MARFLVGISDSPFPTQDPFHEVLKQVDCDVVFANLEDRDAFLHLCGAVDAMIVTYAEITAAVMARFTRCRILARTGVAVNNIDVAEATRRKIYVTNVVTPQVVDVANHAMALLLACAKKIVMLDADVRKGLWSFKHAVPIFKLTNRILGLAGFGNIAREVAHRARSFGLQVIAYDPYVPADAFARYGVRGVGFDELLRTADYVSIHLPLTKETRALFDREAFGRMKPTAYLINTARGGVIDEPALVEALENARIAGAGLDVLSTEFPGENHPLYKFPNVVITPHSAYYSVECVEDLQRSAAGEIVRVLKGEPPVSLVNTELLQTNA
jgi:D-3-phosphoglycerate dehydrogenase